MDLKFNLGIFFFFNLTQKIKGDEILRSGNKYTVDHATGILNIQSVSQAADRGVYTCTVRDRQGHTARRDFTVDVVGKAFCFLPSFIYSFVGVNTCPVTLLLLGRLVIKRSIGNGVGGGYKVSYK